MPDVDVLKKTSWGATRDNLVLGGGRGGIDGAHILTPMPYLMHTGRIVQNSQPVPMAILARLNTNGQAISVAKAHKKLGATIDARPLKAKLTPDSKIAMTFRGGIPLTRRHVANSLLLVTGHACDGADVPDAALIAGHRGTTAIYMGLAALARLAPRLIEAGLDPATPAAVIESGGSRAMRCLRAPFAALTDAAPGWAQAGPCLILIGAGCANPELRAAAVQSVMA